MAKWQTPDVSRSLESQKDVVEIHLVNIIAGLRRGTLLGSYPRYAGSNPAPAIIAV